LGANPAKAPRVFALDSIEEARVLKVPTVDMERAAVDAMVGNDFGIYSDG
jgi:hypothetical protein